MTDLETKQIIVKHTRCWLENFIIKHNICPFAKKEYDNDRIHYAVISRNQTENQIEQQLTAIIDECIRLDEHKEIETSLIIFPDSFPDFEDYLDLVAMANTLLHEYNYEGIYQLASFHPDYQFDQTQPEDAENFTNRSPYPMLHLIREASIEQALENFPNPENIPTRNIELTNQLGSAYLKSILQQCMDKKETTND